MTRRVLSRRLLLRGASGAVLALPLMNVWGCGRSASKLRTDSSSRAGSSRSALTFPKRFVVFYTPNGVRHDAWFPVGGETGFTWSPMLEAFGAANLSFTDKQLSILGATDPDPGTSVANDVLILKGIDNVAAADGAGSAHVPHQGSILTGTPTINTGGEDIGGGISIDEALGQALGAGLPHKVVHFGVQADRKENNHRVYEAISYKGANQPVMLINGEDSPKNRFDLLFPGGTKPGEGTPDPALAAAQHEKKSILQFVRQDFEQLSSTLGAEDRQKLEQHLDGIREVEQQLSAIPSGGGAGCAVPALTPGLSWDLKSYYEDQSNLSVVGKMQMDILAMALSCDLTRVATLQWTQSSTTQVFTELGHTTDHHELSHLAKDLANAKGIIDINAFYARQFAYLVKKLRSIPEGTGTLLDNTVILWINELGDGRAHQQFNIPIVLAGRAGGALKPGRFIQYSTSRSTNDLFVAIAQMLDAGMPEFGSPAYNSGPLSLG